MRPGKGFKKENIERLFCFSTRKCRFICVIKYLQETRSLLPQTSHCVWMVIVSLFFMAIDAEWSMLNHAARNCKS